MSLVECENVKVCTCDICKDTDMGSEVSIEDTDKKQCSRGHVFCASHIGHVKIDSLAKIAELINDHVNDDRDDRFYGMYVTLFHNQDIDDIIESAAKISLTQTIYGAGFSDVFCPICNLKDISDSDLLRYVLNSRHLNRESLLVEMRLNYDNRKMAEAVGMLRAPKRSEEYGCTDVVIDLKGHIEAEKALAVLYGWMGHFNTVTRWGDGPMNKDKITQRIFDFITGDIISEEYRDDEFIRKILNTYFGEYEPDKLFEMYKKDKILKKLE